MENKYLQEYLYVLRPTVDNNLWKKASSTISNALKSTEDSVNQYSETQSKLRIQKEKLAEAQKYKDFLDMKMKSSQTINDTIKYQAAFQQASSEYSQIGSQVENLEMLSEYLKSTSGNLEVNSSNLKMVGDSVSKLATESVVVIAITKELIETGKNLVDTGAKLGNSFVSSSSMFVDSNVRNIMGNYGVSSTQAQGLSMAFDLLDISSSDIGRLTTGQRNALIELQQQYKEGIDSIDSDKLNEFTNSIQEYQLVVAKMSVSLRTSLISLFANSESFPKLVDTFIDAMEAFTTILSSPIVQSGFDTFLSFLQGVVEIVSIPLKGISLLTGKNETTVTASNTNYFYGSATNNAADITNLSLAQMLLNVQKG